MPNLNYSFNFAVCVKGLYRTPFSLKIIFDTNYVLIALPGELFRKVAITFQISCKHDGNCAVRPI